MLDLLGKPMIEHQLERITRARMVSDVVIATSTDSSDDDLANHLTEHGYRVSRGPLDDVLGRFIQVIDEYEPDVVVRITADCPLISPMIIDDVVEQFLAADVDYCSNTLIPTYPDGLDVEVVRSSVLREVHASTQDEHEREHVTLGVYRYPERFELLNHVDPSGANRSDLRWTVDNGDDLAFVKWVFDYLYDAQPDFDYADIVKLIEMYPELSRTDRDAARNAALEGLDTGAMILGEDA